MRNQMTDEDVNILVSLLFQYDDICQKENTKALLHIVKQLNAAWEEAKKCLYKESF